MLVTIPDLFSATQLEAVVSVLRQSDFVDGKLTAGKYAEAGKKNQELDSASEAYEALNNVVMTELVQNPLYLQSALPARICAPIYARYTEGMAYGTHIDDPIMGPPNARFRSDISITIFLNSPEEYEGGELCIETGANESRIKLPAGHAVLYPSTSLHSVAEVTSGERLVAVTWVQSHVRQAERREILLQLDRARQTLAQSEQRDAFRQVDLSYANLFRMWAEP